MHDNGRTETRTRKPAGYLHHYGFRHPYGLWSGIRLHHIFRLRRRPSTLYTFSFRNLARRCHFTGFTEFDRIHIRVSRVSAHTRRIFYDRWSQLL